MRAIVRLPKYFPDILRFIFKTKAKMPILTRSMTRNEKIETEVFEKFGTQANSNKTKTTSSKQPKKDEIGSGSQEAKHKTGRKHPKSKNYMEKIEEVQQPGPPVAGITGKKKTKKHVATGISRKKTKCSFDEGSTSDEVKSHSIEFEPDSGKATDSDDLSNKRKQNYFLKKKHVDRSLQRGAAAVINHLTPVEKDIRLTYIKFKGFMDSLSDENIKKTCEKLKALSSRPEKPSPSNSAEGKQPTNGSIGTVKTNPVSVIKIKKMEQLITTNKNSTSSFGSDDISENFAHSLNNNTVIYSGPVSGMDRIGDFSYDVLEDELEAINTEPKSPGSKNKTFDVSQAHFLNCLDIDVKSSKHNLKATASANENKAEDAEIDMIYSRAKEVTFVLSKFDGEEEEETKPIKNTESPLRCLDDSTEDVFLSLMKSSADDDGSMSFFTANNSKNVTFFVVEDQNFEDLEENVKSEPGDITSYNVTLYEDIVNNVGDDYDYRKEKKIPEWASNERNVELGLMVQAFSEEYHVLEQIFPTRRPPILYPYPLF